MRTPLALPILLMFCSYGAFAGTGCPVDISRAERYSASASAISVEYKNVSGKEIVAVALGVDMYSNDGTMKPLFFELRDREQVAPGKNTEGTWAETMYDRDYPRINVFVKKVKFADATEWKDDGNGTCNSGIAGVIAKGTPNRGLSRPGQHGANAGVVATAHGHGDN
jgi:hypothetical protein